jgi:hypothetical protein
MGYYSNYSLEVEGENALEIIKALREQNKEAEAALGEEGERTGESVKWYNSNSDLIEFSKQYPNVLFHLQREGEEILDIEYFWARDGVGYSEEIKVIYPKFDETKLVKQQLTLLDKHNDLIDSLNKQATAKWGKDCHYYQTIEEAAELIVAIQHKYRSNRLENTEEVAVEVADVYMMIRALINDIPAEILDKALEQQLKRYKGKIDEQ